MTAEIAIMNKQGVALAADSAVTLRHEIEQTERKKIFTTANKIFTLSKYYPIGIMVSGRANFMNVPWETIIKIFRQKLGQKSFDTVRDYASSFLTFLRNTRFMIPEEEQEKHFRILVRSYFRSLKKVGIEREGVCPSHS